MNLAGDPLSRRTKAGIGTPQRKLRGCPDGGVVDEAVEVWRDGLDGSHGVACARQRDVRDTTRSMCMVYVG